MQHYNIGDIMKNTDYKSTNALMEHLRHNGIAISGDSQKQQLINTGYFHGYKGYRFFMSSSKQLPFTTKFMQLSSTTQNSNPFYMLK